jgi:hypothetical protein
MASQKIAVLDRRVRLDKHAGSPWPTFRRISELQPFPYVVLLGEPGIGKSTVLEQLAASEESVPHKVRDVVTGTELERGASLFIDALDEYRIDGGSVDQAHGVGHLIACGGREQRANLFPSGDLHYAARRSSKRWRMAFELGRL